MAKMRPLEIRRYLLSIRKATSRVTFHNSTGKIGYPKFFLFTLLFVLLTVPLFSTGCVSSTVTYSVTINTVYNNTSNGITVPITEDGVLTSFTTPHTFLGLTGTHNFTVPYMDSAGHPFASWSSNAPSSPVFTTITASSGGSFWAFYDTQLPSSVGVVSPAEQHFYITPNDPAVIAAAANKTWSDIINLVSSHITYNFNTNIWQFPNETLALGSGQCREFSTLAVSMLLARGYNAYVVTGNVTQTSGLNTTATNGHAWIVLQLNGTFYQFEPQDSWYSQPSSQQFQGYIAQYWSNNNGLYPAGQAQDPPPAETYDVTIYTSFNGTVNGNHVLIYEDGALTGFNTPYTFVGLHGTHSFTVPYTDASDHPFMSWSNNAPQNGIYPTITVTTGGEFTAFYDTQVNLNNLYPAEKMYLITPSDPAVVEAAANKTLPQIFDYISSLPLGSNTTPQFPNQTLEYGPRFYLDYATLSCSMLLANGYNAFVVGGNSTSTDSWIVININGVFYHVNPVYGWTEQQTIDFISYHASYYVNQSGIFPAGTSQNPPATLPNSSSTPTPTPTVTPTATPSPSPTPSFTPTPTSSATSNSTNTPTSDATATSTPAPTLAPISTNSTNSTSEATPTTTQTVPSVTQTPPLTLTPSSAPNQTALPSIPEFPSWTVPVLAMISILAIAVFLGERKRNTH